MSYLAQRWRIVRSYIFERGFLFVSKNAKTAKNAHIIFHTLPQKPETVEMWKLALGVRMTPALFVFRLCTASIHKKLPKMCCSLVKQNEDDAMPVMHVVFLRQCGVLRTLVTIVTLLVLKYTFMYRNTSN